MIKDGGLTFETQLKIKFLPPNKCSKKCLENPCWCKWNLQFFDQFSRKVLYSLLCGANHQKRLNFFFLLEICIVVL